jgi:hypothetical protein
MKIVCLAWGSLLWKSGPLVLASPWYENGPVLPLEFCRVGDGGELSTAICPGAAPQRSWWARLATADLREAREQLREREEIDAQHPQWVGSLVKGNPDRAAPPAVRDWLEASQFDAVVWTALPPRIGDAEGRCPDVYEALEYLKSLSGETREHAEDYIRRVPVSLDTAYRKAFIDSLGWSPR